MKRAVPVDDNGLATECPKCESTDLCVSNVDGMACMNCGCWFDTEKSGEIVWAYKEHAEQL